MKKIQYLKLVVFHLFCLTNYSANGQNKVSSPRIKDSMVWIPGGEFIMGAMNQSNTNDALPAQNISVKGFWMDVTEVTNQQFEAFVKATNYITVAERRIDWEELKKLEPAGTPKPSEEDLAPGSIVFVAPKNAVNLSDYSQWWKWIKGANWKHPEGPESTIEGRENHPVVHIAYEDALAYAKWAKKRLPTEAEWEFAARGGLEHSEFAWGEELTPNGVYLANFFQGNFPFNNTKNDGFVATSPVKSFPANAFGLYDMIGNVWELCADFYEVVPFTTPSCHGTPKNNPKGPLKTNDPNDPYAVKHVIKGGSFLCSLTYCSNFKPSGRQGSSYDSGMYHTGFRCVK